MNLDPEKNVAPAAAFDPADPTTFTYNTSVTVHDSIGAEHKVDLFFRNNGAGGWEWHAMADGADVGGTPGTPVEVGTGPMTFGPDGQILTGNGSFTANFTNAAPGQAVTLDFGAGATGTDPKTSATAGASSINASDVDGRSSGTLTDLSINDDGTIEGIYDNGDRLKIAQVAIASFANEEGLERQGDSLYIATGASGQALVDSAGTGSRGSIVSGALEASNVDLGTELVTLIAYQRAFQANAKTITTADEMMTDVTNIKR